MTILNCSLLRWLIAVENIPAEPKSSAIKDKLMQFFVTNFSDTQDLLYQVGYPNILIYEFV